MIEQTIGVEVIIDALNQLVVQLFSLIPRLFVALIIWYIGKYLLRMVEKVIRSFDIKRTKVEDRAVDAMARMVQIFGRVVLVLIILDYLGIGRTVVSAVSQGLTFSVAIAVGLAFGKALEDDARDVVVTLRQFLHREKE